MFGPLEKGDIVRHSMWGEGEVVRSIAPAGFGADERDRSQDFAAGDQRNADVRVELERTEHRQVLGIDGGSCEQLVRDVGHHVGLAGPQDGG